AWKASALPLSYTRTHRTVRLAADRFNRRAARNRCGTTQKLWWREKDSNLRRLSRQIYSLLPLTAWVSLHSGKPRTIVADPASVKHFLPDARSVPGTPQPRSYARPVTGDEHQRLGAVADVQRAEDRRHMNLHRTLRDAEQI